MGISIPPPKADHPGKFDQVCQKLDEKGNFESNQEFTQIQKDHFIKIKTFLAKFN